MSLTSYRAAPPRDLGLRDVMNQRAYISPNIVRNSEYPLSPGISKAFRKMVCRDGNGSGLFVLRVMS